MRLQNFSLNISYICTIMYTSLLSLIIWFLKNHIFLCNPFPCVTRRRFSCPSDHFLCILHWIIIWHPVSPSACRFRQVSLYVNDPPTFCIWIVENREKGRIIWDLFLIFAEFQNKKMADVLQKRYGNLMLQMCKRKWKRQQIKTRYH